LPKYFAVQTFNFSLEFREINHAVLPTGTRTARLRTRRRLSMEEEPGADQPAPQGTPTGAPLDAAPGVQPARTEENMPQHRSFDFRLGDRRLGPPRVDRLYPAGWETGIETRASRIPSRASSSYEQREEGPYREPAHRDDDDLSNGVVGSFGFAGITGDLAASDAQASSEARRERAARDGVENQIPGNGYFSF
jgi:hypothetical protein